MATPALSPRDEGVHGPSEVFSVHVVEKRKKIVDFALRLQRRPGSVADDPIAGIFDVSPQPRARDAIVARQVLDEHVEHVGRGIQKHVMDANVKDATLLRVGNHRVAIVGHRKQDRARKGRHEAPLEGLAHSLVNEDLGRVARKHQRRAAAWDAKSSGGERPPEGLRHAWRRSTRSELEVRTPSGHALRGRGRGQACQGIAIYLVIIGPCGKVAATPFGLWLRSRGRPSSPSSGSSSQRGTRTTSSASSSAPVARTLD